MLLKVSNKCAGISNYFLTCCISYCGQIMFYILRFAELQYLRFAVCSFHCNICLERYVEPLLTFSIKINV